MIISLEKKRILKNLNQEKIGTYCFWVYFFWHPVGIAMIFLLVSQFISFLKPSQF